MKNFKNTYFVKLENLLVNSTPDKVEYGQVESNYLSKLNKLQAEGHCIIIVTSISEKRYTKCLLYLYKNKVPFDRLLPGVKGGEIVIL